MEQGLARFALDPDRRTVLVFGGSLGAHTLNEATAEAFAGTATSFQVIHVTGERDLEDVAQRLRRPDANPRYQAHAFLDDLPQAMAAADAVVARAGGSVAEILARGLPSLLVPYPFAAGDHHTKNARMVADAGAASVGAVGGTGARRRHRQAPGALPPRRRRP